MNVLALILAAVLSAGNAEFDRTARDGAAEIAVARIQAELTEKGPKPGSLEKAMLDASGRFQSREEAKETCRVLYGAAVGRAFDEKATAVRERLGLGGDFAPKMSQAEFERATAGFEKAFDAERKAACEKQAKTIAGAVKPTETEVETKDEAALRQDMVERVAAQQKQAVFEENLKYISEKIVDPVIEDARREMKRQREYLSRTRCESYAPEALAKEIEANLRKNVAERQAKAEDPTLAWGVFPGVVRDGIPPVVERRVTGLVTKCVDDVPLAVEADDVLRTMSADPSAHRQAAESEKVFRSAYAAQILGSAIARAEKEAPEKERADFAAFARAHAAASELTRAVETRLKREVLPKWRQVRAEVAKAEAARLWPTLADRTWCPEAELADRLVARSDYAAALKAWRKVPELEDLAKADGGNLLLEETAANVDKSVLEAFDLARTAVTAQNALVGEAEPEVLREAKDRKSSFWRKTPDLKAIVSLLTESVERKWTERRLEVLWGDGERPANADAQHVALFPSVKKRIELVARSILEEMEKSEPDPEQKPEPEEPPPEDPTDSDQQNEEPPLLLFSIVVEQVGDQVNVKLEQGKTTVAERSAKAKMSDYQEAMKYVSDKLGTDILKLKR